MFLNQIRKKIGVFYGNPDIMPGGDANYFAGSDIVKVQRKAIEMSSDKDDPVPLFQTIKFKLEKSKVSRPNTDGLFDIPINNYVDENGVRRNIGGVDNAEDMLRYARKYGVFDEKPGKYSFDGKEFKNQDEIKTAINTDLAFYRLLSSATIKAYKENVPEVKGSQRREDKEDE